MSKKIFGPKLNFGEKIGFCLFAELSIFDNKYKNSPEKILKMTTNYFKPCPSGDKFVL